MTTILSNVLDLHIWYSTLPWRRVTSDEAWSDGLDLCEEGSTYWVVDRCPEIDAIEDAWCAIREDRDDGTQRWCVLTEDGSVGNMRSHTTEMDGEWATVLVQDEHHVVVHQGA